MLNIKQAVRRIYPGIDIPRLVKMNPNRMAKMVSSTCDETIKILAGQGFRLAQVDVLMRRFIYKYSVG
jgi:hypothetical protein